MPPHHHHPPSAPLPAFLAPLPSCRSLRLLRPRTMSHCCPPCTSVPRDGFRHDVPGPLPKGDRIGDANERKDARDEREKGRGRGVKKRCTVPRFVDHDRVRIACCFQQRASIVRLPVAERSPRVREAFTLAAAPTDAGLLQSVELSGELIFQRYQRQRRYLVASTAATPVDDDDEDDDGAIVRVSPRNPDHLAYPLLRRRPSSFLSRLLRRTIYCFRCLVGWHV